MTILEEYKLSRLQKEEEKKRSRVICSFNTFVIPFLLPVITHSIPLQLRNGMTHSIRGINVHFTCLQDQKRLQDLLLTERESIYGSKPSPRRASSFRMSGNGYRNGNGSMTPTPRRSSVGSPTMEPMTPRSYSSRQNGYSKEMRRLTTTPLNFVAIPKEDTISFSSVYGSEPGSPLQS